MTEPSADGATRPPAAVPDGPAPGSVPGAAPDQRPAGSPQRRYSQADLDRIFGVEQVGTNDDQPEPEVPRADWYRENTPPHHG